MGGTKAAIDDLRAAVRANITMTIDITSNDKDRVGVDVAWNRRQLTILVIMLVSSTRLTLKLVCAYTHIYVHTRIQASPASSPTHDHIVQ